MLALSSKEVSLFYELFPSGLAQALVLGYVILQQMWQANIKSSQSEFIFLKISSFFLNHTVPGANRLYVNYLRREMCSFK